MSRYTPTRINNPCILCEDASGKCRTLDTGSLHFCMTHAGHFETIPGFQFLGLTKNGLWGKWKPETEHHLTEQDRETWRLQQQTIRRQRLLEKQQRQAQSMPVAERDRHYRNLLTELTLHPDDRADLHHRGFTDAQIEAVGFKSVVAGQRLSKPYPKNLPGIAPNKRSWQRLDRASLVVAADGYLCPVRNSQGKIQGMQLRVRGASANKYRWLSSTENPVNLPNGELPLAILTPDTLADSNAVALVEGTGAKPFLAAQRLGMFVIGAAGGQWASSPEQLRAIAEDRPLILIPDGGAVRNSHVMRQYSALIEEFPNLQVYWWDQTEKGADIDEISEEQLATARLISWTEFEAIAFTYGSLPKRRGKRITVRPGRGGVLNRTPDLNIQDDEFKAHVDQFPTSGITALWGPQGSGKGEAIAQMLGEATWLSVTTLRSLARDQAEGWNGVFINDGDIVSNRLLKDGQPVAGGSVCLPSLLKLRAYNPEILILDELPTITDFLTGSKLSNKDGIRPLLIEELSRKIREAQHVIVASADLREEGLRWIEDLRDEQAYLIRSTRLPLPWTCHVFDGKQSQAIAELLERVKNLPDGQLLTIHTDNKSLANKISALLLEQNCPNLLITSDTSGGEVESSFLSSKGQDIPALLAMGIKVIVTSPSVKEGFSIQHHTDKIDSVWGIFEGCSITADSAAQTLNRVRSLAPRFVWIAEKGRAYSKLSLATSIGEFLKDLKHSSSTKVELVRRSLKTETLAIALNIDWHAQNLRLLADGEVRRNRGMKAFKHRVLENLKREGKTIAKYACQVTRDQAVRVSKRMEEIRSRLQLERAIAIASAPQITEAQVKELEKKQVLTPEELLSLERYYLEQFYRTTVTCDDVLWDKNGARRKQIRNLEMVLSPEKAERDTAASIEQNASTPQDWSRARLQLDLLERCGLVALICSIYAGEVVDLSPEQIAAIAACLRNDADEFTLAFNFRNPHSVSDMQLVGHCLDWCGLKRIAKRIRVEGKPKWVYQINQDNLEELKAAIERRSCVDLPPGISIETGEGRSEVKLPSNEDWMSPEALDDVRQILAVAPDEVIRALILEQIPFEVRGAIAQPL
jgi:TusA-related sulfurtransferase